MKKSISCRILLIFLIFGILFPLSSYGEDRTVRIEGRDWGYPSPYAFYPRGPGYVRMMFVFDTLAWRDDRQIIPWLAQNWESSPDGKSWHLRLTENARWHDGEPFTAEDVKFTLDYFKTHPHPWFDLSVVDTAEITGPYEVKIILSRPYAVFQTRILSRVPMIPEHIWEKVENPYQFAAAKEAVTGTGPFVLQDYNPAQGSYLFTANPHFFKGKVKIDRLISVPTKTGDLSLLRGEIDMTRILKIDSLELFKNKAEFKILTAPDYWLFRLVINFTQEPMQDLQFRRALAHAVNRPEMVERVAHGGGVAGTYAYISPASEWHNPTVTDYPYDPEEARKLLDGMNIKDRDGDGFRELPPKEKFRVRLLSDKRFSRAAEAVKKYLEEVGLSVQIDSADVSTHDTRIREMKDFHLALTAHGGVSGDLGNLTGGLPAIKGYQNEMFRRLTAEQPYMTDPEKRKQALFSIQELIAADVATIPLYYLNWFHVYRPAVFDGWFYTWYGLPMGVQLLENKLAFVEVP